MTTIPRSISRALAMIIAALPLFMSPLMMGVAMAQTITTCTPNAPGSFPAGSICQTNSQCASCICTALTCQVAEMSDYLAMAFVVAAGGMIFYFRRRTLARA